MAEAASQSPKSSPRNPQRAVERAVSLIRKAEVKSVPRRKIRDFLKRKELDEDQIKVAYAKFFSIENIVEIPFPARPLGFSVVMDPQGKNAVVSSIQDSNLETEHGLERLSRIVKVNERWVEHKKHQNIIDAILDKECPITFTFRKRKHPKRGSLFQKIERPSRSQPAQKSAAARGSYTVLPGMEAPGKGAKQRGSMISGARGSVVADNPKLFNPNSMDQWDSQNLSKEEQGMKEMLAKLTANQALSSDVTSSDDHLSNLSKRTRSLLHMQSTKKLDDVDMSELDDYGKEMFGLWKELDDLDDTLDDDPRQDDVDKEKQTFDAHVITEAKNMRIEALESLSQDSGDAPVGRPRLNSAPVYSTDALIEMHKGTALMKYGKRGSPKFRMFQLSRDNLTLTWFSDRKKLADTKIPIEEMTEVLTEIKHDSRDDPELIQTSFAVVYGGEKKLRLTAKNVTEAFLWTQGLKLLITKKDQNQPLHLIKSLIVEKQQGLDLHRRQSLANLMEQRTGAAGQDMRQRSVKKVTKEIAGIRKSFVKCSNMTATKKFKQVFMPNMGDVETNKKKKLEKDNINELLANINERITALEGQVETLSDAHEELFDSQLNQIKADSWNTSVDLVALKCKLDVLCSNPTEL